MYTVLCTRLHVVNAGVVIQPLCHQLYGELVPHPAILLQFSPLVLEPDLDLSLVKLQRVRQS